MENYISERARKNAEAEAEAIVANARQAAAERIRRAKVEIERDSEVAMERAKKQAIQEEKQAAIVAKTREHRANIAHRQAVIDKVFANARAELLSASAKDVQTLVAALVKAEGKAGDTVLVSKADDKKVTAEFVKGLSVKNLKREVCDSFEGGIKLENDRYELSLTLDDLLGSLRDGIELEVSKILF